MEHHFGDSYLHALSLWCEEYVKLNMKFTRKHMNGKAIVCKFKETLLVTQFICEFYVHPGIMLELPLKF